MSQDDTRASSSTSLREPTVNQSRPTSGNGLLAMNTSTVFNERSESRSPSKKKMTTADDPVARNSACFKLFEGKNKGYIEKKDLGPLLRICMKNPSEKQLKEYISEMDLVADEYITLEQFQYLMNRVDLPDIDGKKDLIKAFEVWDTEQRGFVTVTTMRAVLGSFGDAGELTNEEIEEIITTFAEDIPAIPKKETASEETNSQPAPATNTKGTEQTDKEVPEKVIYYDKFLRTCFSNVNIHDKPPKKKRGKSKSPTKR